MIVYIACAAAACAAWRVSQMRDPLSIIGPVIVVGAAVSTGLGSGYLLVKSGDFVKPPIEQRTESRTLHLLEQLDSEDGDAGRIWPIWQRSAPYGGPRT